MSDLVATIRAIMAKREDGVPDEVCAAAAARIEALETALREIEDCLDYVKDKGVVWKIVRAALDKDAGK
jgi:hypothetical protein